MENFDALANELIESQENKKSARFYQYLIDYLQEAYGVKPSILIPDVECYVNCQANTYAFQGKSERNNIVGSIQLSPGRTAIKLGQKITATKIPSYGDVNLTQSKLLYDSLAFTDVLTNSRVSLKEALDRQLTTLNQIPVAKETLIVSYDRLIDEKFINGTRRKLRWTIEEGEQAVFETIEAAKYLDLQRERLQGKTLVQSCQGVDALQYKECVEQILKYCKSNDIVGLGGWCILGRQSSYLPIFEETIAQIIPLIAKRNIQKVHIFGCTWYKDRKKQKAPLSTLFRICKNYGISVSTDSTSPIKNALWKTRWKRAGAVFPYWRDNLAWVKAELATLGDRCSDW